MQALRSWSHQRWMLWGAFVVTVVTFVAYFSSLRIGFWMDDYIAIDFAGRLAGLNYTVTDVILLPIDASVPVGNDYQLVIGIYDAHTGARVLWQDSQGRPLGDAITISSFKVVE